MTLVPFMKQFMKVLLIGLLSIILLEGTLRLYNHFRPSYLLPSDDKILRYRGRPHAQYFNHTLNAGGFNDIDYPLQRQKDTLRILALGDSFVFGLVPYENNFLTLMERKFIADGRNIEIINMGIVGTEPPEYYRLLRDEGIQYHSDLVMVFLFMGNDIVYIRSDNTTASPLWKRSYVWTFLSNVSSLISARQTSTFRTGTYQEKSGPYTDKDHIEGMILNHLKYVYEADGRLALTDTPEMKARLQQSLNAIQKMNDLCRSNGVQMLVVMLPEDVQVDAAAKAAVEPELRKSDLLDWVDYTIPNRLVAQYLEGNGIKYIDLMPAFQQFSAKQLYIPDNGHWNIEGNAFAADLLYHYLNKKDVYEVLLHSDQQQ